jgi:AbrB family looped-hinge helix DNA binding protein
MNEQTTRVTRKGQVTIPIAIREALGLKEGDSVIWQLEEKEVSLRRGGNVVARTAGILKSKSLSLTTEEERDATAQAIAEDVQGRGSR